MTTPVTLPGAESGPGCRVGYFRHSRVIVNTSPSFVSTSGLTSAIMVELCNHIQCISYRRLFSQRNNPFCRHTRDYGSTCCMLHSLSPATFKALLLSASQMGIARAGVNVPRAYPHAHTAHWGKPSRGQGSGNRSATQSPGFTIRNYRHLLDACRSRLDWSCNLTPWG